METQFIEFTAKVGSWEPGTIESMPRSVAEGYVAAGQAKPSDALAHMRASLQADSDKRFDAFEERVLKALKPDGGAERSGRKPAPPGTADFGNVVGSSVPAEEQDKRRGLADALRCVFIVNAAGVDPAMHEYARRRLRGYSDEYTEYSFNEQTGAMDITVSRQLANGGTEMIKRTGTDSISGGATYGFTLKPEYLGNLFRISREQEVFAAAAMSLPVGSGNEVRWPALDQYSAPTKSGGIMQAAVFGGITLAYKGEVTARAASDATTNMIDFKIVDLTGYTTYSRDYIVDNYIAMDSIVTQIFGAAMAWVEDWVTIQGDGNAKPLGFMNANATQLQTRNTASHIKYEDLVGMLSKFSPMVWRQGRWLTNVTAVPDLAAITNNAGNYVFQPNALIAQSQELSVMSNSTADAAVHRPMGTLLGLPVYFTEKVSILGTKGDLCLVAPSQYGIARRAGVEVGVSEHFLFSTDQIAYRFKLRHDGRPLWRAPYQQADNPTTPGSGTKVSPFVVLN